MLITRAEFRIAQRKRAGTKETHKEHKKHIRNGPGAKFMCFCGPFVPLVFRSRSSPTAHRQMPASPAGRRRRPGQILQYS